MIKKFIEQMLRNNDIMMVIQISFVFNCIYLDLLLYLLIGLDDLILLMNIKLFYKKTI